MSIETTLQERKRTHGDFRGMADLSQQLKSTFTYYRSHSNVLSTFQAEALDMIFHKIARIGSGDPNVSDHWHDIAGYALLVEKQLTEGAETSDS